MCVRYSISKATKQELVKEARKYSSTARALEDMNHRYCGLNFKYSYEAFAYVYKGFDDTTEKEMTTSVIVVIRENADGQEYADIVLDGTVLPGYKGISVGTALLKLMEFAETGDAELFQDKFLKANE